MKRSGFNEEQIIGILREAEGQETVKTVSAKHTINEAAFYAWRRKYGGMEVSEVRKLRSLEDENARLKGSKLTSQFRTRSLRRLFQKSDRPFSQTASDTDDCC